MALDRATAEDMEWRECIAAIIPEDIYMRRGVAS